MSLQPSDAAADAFDRLRGEVALLRRAVEGLVSDAAAPVDYSPTLAELSDSIAEVGAQAAALSERPLLALAPEQLGSLFQIAAAKVLAKPVAALERERAALREAAEALRIERQAADRRSQSWRRWAGLVGAGAVCGIFVWSLLLGPLVRILPPRWAVPERLASATLALPMGPAGERLLLHGDPARWEALQVVNRLPQAAMADLRDCGAPSGEGKAARTCTLKLK
jgi:hypothetical protein